MFNALSLVMLLSSILPLSKFTMDSFFSFSEYLDFGIAQLLLIILPRNGFLLCCYHQLIIDNLHYIQNYKTDKLPRNSFLFVLNIAFDACSN